MGLPGLDAEEIEPMMIPGPVGPAGAAGSGSAADPPQGSYAPGSYTIADGKFRIAVKRQQFTTTQRLTIAGTGRLTVVN